MLIHLLENSRQVLGGRAGCGNVYADISSAENFAPLKKGEIREIEWTSTEKSTITEL